MTMPSQGVRAYLEGGEVGLPQVVITGAIRDRDFGNGGAGLDGLEGLDTWHSY